MKNFYYILFLLLPTLVFVGCSDETIFHEGDEQVILSYSVSLDDETDSRVIGDGSKVDTLLVGIFQEGVLLTQQGFKLNEQMADISLQLIKDQTYQLVFWGQNQNNKAYSFENDCITVDYSNYIEGGFSKMEEMDAFYAIKEVTVETKSIKEPETIKLSRPFAQLNFADNTTKPIQGTHKAVVTFHKIPKSFNPFTGEISFTDPEDDTDDVSFIFKDFPLEETLNTNNATYYYAASNYLLTTAEGTTTIDATLDLQQIDGTSINKFEFKGEKAITLEKNKKTNVLGTIVLQPETCSVWDGIIPTVSTLTTDSENQNRYIIDEANDVAWLSVQKNAQSLKANSTFVMTVDVDMNNGSGLDAIQLPSGSTLDGDGHTIKGLQLENALLGDVTNITVKNLTVKETTVANTSDVITHVGILVNTLKGSNKFSNIHVKSSSVSTQNGAAGGIVGYISRNNPDNRKETLTVIFDDCHVTETTVDGTHSEGHFVGLLRGYDNKETLQFNSNCTLTLSANARLADDFLSPYCEGNESVWLADNDYSKYDGWLGDEECYRGTVMYGENRFIPCWDGITTITPLTDGTSKLIYSAFDLASLQGSSHTAVTFKEDVDLGGDKANNKNPFTPISKIYTLDGEEHTIYNLYINVTNWIGGFIGASSSTTIHKNLYFSNSAILVKPSSGSELAYAGTLCSYIEGNYTVENIRIENAYVLGISKSGGLNGYVTSGATFYTAKKNTINNLRLENSYLHISGETFAASGEMGGLVGFIQQSSLIESCSVTNSVINCSNSFLRHVNQFIGTIRLDNSSHRIDINKCTVSGNSYENEKDEKSKFVGGYSLSSFLQKGKVYIDGKRLY